MHVSVLSCEHTCTTTQHYNAFQCFVVTAMKTHGNKADLISSLMRKLDGVSIGDMDKQIREIVLTRTGTIHGKPCIAIHTARYYTVPVSCRAYIQCPYRDTLRCSITAGKTVFTPLCDAIEFHRKP